MNNARFHLAALLLALLMAAAMSSEATLYKLVDKNGKVTYSEVKPDNFDGTVTTVDVPAGNTMAAPKPPADARGETGMSENEKIIRRKVETKGDKLQAAQDKADEVCKAFEDARDHPGDSDVTWVSRGANPLDIKPGDPQSKVGQPTLPDQSKPSYNPALPKSPTDPNAKIAGAHPVASSDYVERLAAMEKDCKAAKDELDKVRQEIR